MQVNKEYGFFSGASMQRDLIRLSNTDFSNQFRGLMPDVCSDLISYSVTQFSKYPEVFEKSCSFNIENIGGRFADDLAIKHYDEDTFYELFVKCYRFLSEFSFHHESESLAGLSSDVYQVLSKVRYSSLELPKHVKSQLVYADNYMPVALAKEYLKRPEFALVKEFDVRYSELGSLLGTMDSSLGKHKKDVEDLRDALDKYKVAFNFVGLHKGFDDLARSKRISAIISMGMMFVLALLMAGPIVVKIWWAVTSGAYLVPSLNVNLDLLLPVLGLELLLLYFFRIVFHGYKSLKGQLLQLDLRRAVCQFIQSYADYAVKIKGENPALLEKFEALVFSGIVTNEEKIPSTFDGFEHVSKLFEKLK